MKRIDERDMMFSRMGYQENTPEYHDYYKRHPEKKAVDDELRSMPPLCGEETPTFDPILGQAADANFGFLGDIRHLATGTPAKERKTLDSQTATKLIKQLTLHYGALDVRCCEAEERFYYTHRGRHPENYGEEIDASLKNAIVFSVKMDNEVINTAPQVSACVETSYGYIKAAIAGLQVAYFLRSLGYQARCHMDANYLLMLTPLAQHAGLGQIGRHGLLIGHKGGSAIRLGAVTTDLELDFDATEDKGIQRFCLHCGLCVKTCPAKTITDSDNPKDFKIEHEACYRVWRNIGTDCGICISACPLEQGIDIEKLNEMTDDEMDLAVAQYREKNGPRKYRKDKYFI